MYLKILLDFLKIFIHKKSCFPLYSGSRIPDKIAGIFINIIGEGIHLFRP